MQPEALTDAQLRTASAYNAAADFYDAPALGFWERLGRRSVERMGLNRGAIVLDACCGSGASAIPAAQAVGREGRVLGVDLADNLLRLARAKAARLGLAHAEFRLGEIESLQPSLETFDAVVCVFGIFFLPDMPAGVRSLWRLVRPGGQMAITTWGPRLFEPGNSAFWEAVRSERPDLYKSFNPWDRITDPASLAAMLREGGVSTADASAESSLQPLNSPEDFWTIVLGSGYRGTVEHFDSAARERVRLKTVDSLCRQNVRSVETNAIFALAKKSEA